MNGQQETKEVKDGETKVVNLLMDIGAVRSLSEARRIICQGGITLGEDRKPVDDIGQVVQPENNMIVWVGKRKAFLLKLAL